MATFSVILPAAGQSSRFHDKHYKKPFAPLADRPVWLHSAEQFLKRDDVKQLMIVVAPEDRDYFNEKFAANVAILGIQVVNGGAERVDSVTRALTHVDSDVDYVAIHDAARPCIAQEWIDEVFQAAQKQGAAILALPLRGTLKRAGDNKTIKETVPRQGIWEAQTPQVFRRQLLMDAYARRGSLQPTDDAELVEHFGHPVVLVPGSPVNIKITTKADLQFAAHALKAMPKPKVIGPAHPFEDDDMWR